MTQRLLGRLQSRRNVLSSRGGQPGASRAWPNGFLFKAASDILITNRGQPLLSGRRPARSELGLQVLGRWDKTRQSCPLTRNGVRLGGAMPAPLSPGARRCWVLSTPRLPRSRQPVDALGWEGGDQTPPLGSLGAVPPTRPHFGDTLPPATSSRLLSSVSSGSGAWGLPGVRPCPRSELAGLGEGSLPPPASRGEQRGSRGFHVAGRAASWLLLPGGCLGPAHVPGVTVSVGVGAAAQPPSWLLDRECLGAAEGHGGLQSVDTKAPSTPQQTCFLGRSPAHHTTCPGPGLTSVGAERLPPGGPSAWQQAGLPVGVLWLAVSGRLGSQRCGPVGRGFGQV